MYSETEFNVKCLTSNCRSFRYIGHWLSSRRLSACFVRNRMRKLEIGCPALFCNRFVRRADNGVCNRSLMTSGWVALGVCCWRKRMRVQNRTWCAIVYHVTWIDYNAWLIYAHAKNERKPRLILPRYIENNCRREKVMKNWKMKRMRAAAVQRSRPYVVYVLAHNGRFADKLAW